MSRASFDNPDGSQIQRLQPKQTDKKKFGVDDNVDDFTIFCRKNPFYPAGISDYVEPSFGEYCLNSSDGVQYEDWRHKGPQKKMKNKNLCHSEVDPTNPFSPAGLPNELEPPFSEQCCCAVLDSLLLPRESTEDINRRSQEPPQYITDGGIVPFSNVFKWSSVSVDLPSAAFFFRPQPISVVRATRSHSYLCKTKGQNQEEVQTDIFNAQEEDDEEEEKPKNLKLITKAVEDLQEEKEIKSSLPVLKLPSHLSLPIIDTVDHEVYTDAVETLPSADFTSTTVAESLAFIVNEIENPVGRRFSDPGWPSVVEETNWSPPLSSPEWKPVCSNPGWRPVVTEELQEAKLPIETQEQIMFTVKEATLPSPEWRQTDKVSERNKTNEITNERKENITTSSDAFPQKGTTKADEILEEGFALNFFEMQEPLRSFSKSREKPYSPVITWNENLIQEEEEEESVVDVVETPKFKTPGKKEVALPFNKLRHSVSPLQERQQQRDSMYVRRRMLFEEELTPPPQEILSCQLQAMIRPQERNMFPSGSSGTGDTSMSLMEVQKPLPLSVRDRLYLNDRNLKAILAIALVLPFLMYLLPAFFAFLLR